MKNPLINSLEHSRIFIVDKDIKLTQEFQRELNLRGATSATATSLKEARIRFHRFHPDAVICDLSLPDGNGIELLKEWHEENPNLPVILITSHPAIDSAITALRLGAFDYLPKPFDTKDLIAALKRASEVSFLRQKVQAFEGHIQKREPITIVGSSEAMEEHRRLLKKLAKSKSDTILILGESGTGKELSARAVHDWSDRSHEPYVEINCASIPETLLESELFGHEKGAFTDARKRKIGLFEIAGKGTVFLDEIGEMPLKIQAKLLRVLESRRFKRLGGVLDIEVKARITVATNKDLRLEIARKNFRADLYYRLNALPIVLPPLRERCDDIPELTTYFLKTLSNFLELPRPEISSSALDKLMNFNWPGNIRELKNTLQRSLVYFEPDLISAEHLSLDPPIQIAEEFETIQASEFKVKKSSTPVFDLPENGINLDEVEKRLLLQSLEKSKYNQTKAAKLLGISRHTLRYRLEKHHLINDEKLGK